VTYAMKLLGGRNARAFSLNLAPDIEHRARNSPDWLRRRIIRILGNGTPLTLVFDANRDGRLHLSRVHVHGCFVAVDAADAARIDRGLKLAGGEWAARRGQKHQLDTKVLGEESGPISVWAHYLSRKLAPASKALSGGPLWSVTRGARAAAEALHDTIRRTVNTAPRDSAHAV
jgi:hypothetical protein